MLKVNQFSLFDLVVKKVAFITVLTCGLMLLSSCEKARVDAELERLCKQDGGLKIYENVILSENQFTKYGYPIFFITWNKDGGEYRFISDAEYIKKDKPTLTKYTYSIERKIDNKILSVYVTYSRIGGDILPRLGPDSYNECPKNISDNDLIKKTFVKN